MATLAQRLWKAGNVAAVCMYRRTGGKVGGTAKGGSLVLLLTGVLADRGRRRLVREAKGALS